jgi:P27 family predicted phage terminase small subunit
MARGRRAQPDAVREAKGNPGKRRRAAPPDMPDLPIGAPDWLTGRDARTIWKKLHGDLVAAKILRSTDINAFARYCTYMAEWVALKKRVDRLRMPTYWTNTNHGKMKRVEPILMVRDRLEGTLTKLEDQLGLNPRARQSIFAQLASFAAPPPGDLFGGRGDDDAPAPSAPEPSPVGMLGKPH